MTITTIGIDLGKNKMHMVGIDDSGHVVERRVFLSRTVLIRYLSKSPQARVAMEACAGAHFLGRKAEAVGHDARLLPGQYVRGYVKSQKNDHADAEAIAEAATRATMRQIPIKAVDQQELQLLYPKRQSWFGQRAETANRIRAVLLEFGITIPKGMHPLRRELPFVLEDHDNGLPERTRQLLHALWRDLLDLHECVD